jgi:hypothetical protein
MNRKQNKLINRIIEKYNEINNENPDKIDLLIPAKEIKNVFFEDFKKELIKADESNKIE